MPVRSRQERLRAGDEITAEEMAALREVNAGRRRARREREPDDERIAELEEYRYRAIEMQRPYYAINGSTRTADLLARLADVNNPPTDFERQNIVGMLEVNNRFKWWKRRHPNQ